MCISPADGSLYISDPEKHQVRRVLSLEKVREPEINSEPVVGNGDRCIPGDDSNCGDEGPAIKAKLAHPKGMKITNLNIISKVTQYILIALSFTKAICLFFSIFQVSQLPQTGQCT